MPELHCLVAILLHFYDELRLAIHLHSCEYMPTLYRRIINLTSSVC